MIKYVLFACLLLLPACAKLDSFNKAHPNALYVEDSLESGAEEAGDLILHIPAGTLEHILGQSQASHAVIAQ